MTDITKNLAIQGAGPGVTIIDGGGTDRVFHINPFLAAISVMISGVTITGGNPGSDKAGGGILNSGTAMLSLTNVTVSGNTAATGFGGGILNAGTAILTNVNVAGNTGGGIRNVGPATLTNVIVSGNRSSGFGGGIINIGSAAVLSLTDVTISGNTATFDGGGILNNGGTLTLTRVTVAGNAASENGGGIAHGAGTASLTNVTISGNSAKLGGGGIFNLSSPLTLTNVTVSGNSAEFGADGILRSGGSVQLKNTVIANNHCSGPVTSLGHNLDSGATCGFAAPGDLSSTNPLLGPLANYGGPTQTHALLPGSPAINAATNSGCPSIDQRGIARPQGATCDIGAFEFGVIVAAVQLNGSAFHTGQQITYQATLNPGLAPTQVDIYLGCLLPDFATFLSLIEVSPGVISIAPGPSPIPFRANVTLTQAVVPFSYTFAGLEPAGTYFAYAGLAVAGSDPFQPTNQLSLGVQAFQFTP